MDNEFSEPIEELILKIFDESGLELFDFKLNLHKQRVSFQILVDKPNGGITLEECAQLNQRIQHQIDEGRLLETPYTLEISSPGADRPLQQKKDFLRVLNREVHFVLFPLDHLKGEYIGELKDVTDQEVLIISKGQEVRIPRGSIKKAQQNL